MIKGLSMGAGVQTTALLIMNPNYDFVIFADPGGEDPETYEYIEKYLKPFCKEHGMEWITVIHKSGLSLMEWCLKRRILPIRARRWCTKDFKIKPINRFISGIGINRKDPIHVDLGISFDEAHRANFHKDDVQYVIKHFPLVDAQLTRKDCYKIILEHGWPIPPKSGCVFCPFQNRRKIIKFRAKFPFLFKEIVVMEKNDRYYPRKPLIGSFTLESLEKNDTLDAFVAEGENEIDSCETGHCFV